MAELREYGALALCRVLRCLKLSEFKALGN